MSVVIFSDLDGTLLDHHDYSWDVARESIAWLRAQRIPLVLNTSKTAAETAVWHQRFGLDAPYVIENGAAILRADGVTMRAFGTPREKIIESLSRLRAAHGWRFHGFADADTARITAWTGLSEVEAVAAADRSYTEPLRWDDSNDAYAAFRDAVTACGWSVTRGGRFVHVQGDHDKGRALRWLVDRLDCECSIACGDGRNDVPMLAAASIAVCVRSPAHEYPTVPPHVRVLRTRGAGPSGWVEAIDQLRSEGVLKHD